MQYVLTQFFYLKKNVLRNFPVIAILQNMYRICKNYTTLAILENDIINGRWMCKFYYFVINLRMGYVMGNWLPTWKYTAVWWKIMLNGFRSILTLISRNFVGPDVKIRIILPLLYGFLFCWTNLKYGYIKCIPIHWVLCIKHFPFHQKYTLLQYILLMRIRHTSLLSHVISLVNVKQSFFSNFKKFCLHKIEKNFNTCFTVKWITEYKP